MREAVLDAGWGALLFAAPLLVMLLIGFSRLRRLISATRMEKAADFAFEYGLAMGMRKDKPPLRSDPQGLMGSGPSRS